MRLLIACLFVCLLPACTGLDTTWRFQMQMDYATPRENAAAALQPAVNPAK